ncbi:MAG: SDR family oxidoreductase [Leptospiraceae bacterium]
MKVYVAGSTGLVGRFLLNELAQRSDVNSVLALIRDSGKEHSSANSRIQYQTIDFQNEESYPDFQGPVYCCLGTTMKKAGSREAFEQVDYHYPMNLARKCVKKDLPFHVITALGSNDRSSIYYNRVKGKLEMDLQSLGLSSLHIYRPSLLLGPRKESRAGESLGALAAGVLNPFLIGPVRKYRGIQARDVARCMAMQTEPGTHILESDAISEIARASRK